MPATESSFSVFSVCILQWPALSVVASNFGIEVYQHSFAIGIAIAIPIGFFSRRMPCDSYYDANEALSPKHGADGGTVGAGNLQRQAYQEIISGRNAAEPDAFEDHDPIPHQNLVGGQVLAVKRVD